MTPTRTVADLPRPRAGWAQSSACTDHDAAWWDLGPTDRDGTTDNAMAARGICASCPVRRDCLLDSLHNPDRLVGKTTGAIRGGYTPDGRGQLLDRRGIERPKGLHVAKSVPPQQRTPYRPLDCALIDQLRRDGATWTQIAAQMHVVGSTARAQWRRWQQRQDRIALPRVRGAA